MLVVEHSTVRMPTVVDYRRERTPVSQAQGATSLAVKEVELHPGWERRLHTHPTDIAVWVTGGAVLTVIVPRVRYAGTGPELDGCDPCRE